MAFSTLQVGQAHSLTVLVTAELVARFTDLSGDAAPLHTNEAFARAAGFSGALVHGALLVALVSRLVGMEFPGPNAILQRIDLSFPSPCYAPCTLKLTGTVRQISEAMKSVVLDISITAEDGRVVARGKTWHGILDTSLI